MKNKIKLTQLQAQTFIRIFNACAFDQFSVKDGGVQICIDSNRDTCPDTFSAIAKQAGFTKRGIKSLAKKGVLTDVFTDDGSLFFTFPDDLNISIASLLVGLDDVDDIDDDTFSIIWSVCYGVDCASDDWAMTGKSVTKFNIWLKTGADTQVNIFDLLAPHFKAKQ